MTRRHLFLDLDGTLTDPREGVVRSIAHALSALNRASPAPEELERFIGPPLAQTFRKILGSTDETLIASAIGAYRERFGSIGIFENRVYPDVPAALRVLTKRGFVLRLLTSKPKVFATRILEHFELSAYFANVYAPDLEDLNGTKAELFRRALTAEALEPKTVAVIGDRKEDVLAARENGSKSIGVTWGYGSRQELEDAGADHIVGSVSELVSCIGADRWS